MKKSHPLFLQILKVCLLNTCLAKFWALIFIQRLFTLSVSFGFHGPPLLTFKTELRGLNLGKSDIITHWLKISACKRSLLCMQNTSLKIWKPELPCWILIQPRTNVFSVFTWRHDRHVGALNKENAAMLVPATKSSGNLTLLLCKRFLLFSLKNMAVDHVSENQQLHSLIAPDVTAAILVERTVAKKSFGNLTLLLCKIWATFFYCFGTNMAV